MEKVKISKVCKISNGYAFKSNKYTSEEGARVIRITNVQKGKIVDNDPKIYPNSELSKLENYKIFENDILMSLTGNVGRVGKFPKGLLPAYINQRVCRVMPKSNELHIDYLFHFLNSDKFEKDAIQNSAGAAQLNLSTNWLAEYKIPLPSIETQKQIAQILDDAAALRNKTEQLIIEYDALAQSIFLDMFGDTWTNPKCWKEYFVEDLAKKEKHAIKAGPFGSSLKKEFYVEEGYKIYGQEQVIYDDFIYGDYFINEDLYQKLKSCKISSGDILISLVGTYGKISIVPEIFQKGIINPRLMKISPDLNIVRSDVLKKILQSNGVKIQLKNKSRGQTMGVLNLGIIKKIKIPVPPIELQNQFAEKITLIEKQKELAKQELKESEDLFNCLLQKAFKGELV